MPANVYAAVTATISKQLQTADPAAFVCPWHRSGSTGLPTNANTQRPYRGINILALWCAARAAGFGSDRWATYRQWTALGAQVRRGEAGTPVLFYRELTYESDASSGAPRQLPSRQQARGDAESATDRAVSPRVARTSFVFNQAQVDGFEEPDIALDTAAAFDPMPRFAAFVAATGAEIEVGGDRAAYVPNSDLIRLPPRERFHSPGGYAATLAHELCHWSGAPHRLARDLSTRFGSRAYAAEELVAELGSAFVLASLQLATTPHPNHAAYIAGWLPLVQTDPCALITAAAQASRAADYLLGAPASALSETDGGEGA
ncbi:ArdC family protein [Aureimonas psammosilenae]|uniref:ArdC family protein n=1 Tax=Aureimonas psammosilenae TaxID=2495496 RepID=UPI001260FDF0|nr:zincin-like metallopeptidase domain-containing protein [Aureimonas psammosilenae]